MLVSPQPNTKLTFPMLLYATHTVTYIHVTKLFCLQKKKKTLLISEQIFLYSLAMRGGDPKDLNVSRLVHSPLPSSYTTNLNQVVFDLA